MPLYTKESLELLRDKIDLVQVITSHVDMKRAGAAFKGLCPFHDEKSPSFMIHQGDKFYHCFGCGAHGDAIQFMTQYVKLSFSDAIENLAERFHVKMEVIEGGQDNSGPSKADLKRALELASEFFQFHLLHTPEGKLALKYLEDRGIGLDFIEAFDIGWAPEQPGMLKSWLNKKKISNELQLAAGLLNKGYRDFFSARIQFPIKDASGAVIGFSGRKIKEETFGGKYINTSETTLFKKSKVLFGIDHSRKRIVKDQRAVIVEGQVDCLQLIFRGLNITVAGQGTAFGEGHARELIQLGVKQVFLALDADNAGQEATVKIGNIFQKSGVEVVVVEFPPGDDPDAFIKKEGMSAFLRKLEESGGYLPFLVRYESRKQNVTTTAGKAAMVNTLAQQIKLWEDPVMVYESLRLLARLAQVPEEFLGLGEQHTNIHIKKTGLAGAFEVNHDRILEGDLLRWVAFGDNPKFLEVIAQYLQPGDFASPTCRELYQALQTGDLCSVGPDVQSLLEEIEKRKVNQDKSVLFFTKSLQEIVDRNLLRKREDIRIKIQSNRYSEDEVLALTKVFSDLSKTKVICG